MPSGTIEQRIELLDGGCFRGDDAAHAGQRGLASAYPVVNEDRMAGEERRHAKPGGIADTEKSFKPSFKRHKRAAATVAPHMFHDILREAANKIDRQHLGAERPGKLGALGDS